MLATTTSSNGLQARPCHPLASTTVLTLALLAAPLSATSHSDPSTGNLELETRPCRADDRHDRLDFLLGTWRVVDATGAEIATARVERRHGGCLIEEEWTARSGWSGQAISYLDPSSGTWMWQWVDGRGAVMRGESEAGAEAMRFVGERILPDGRVQRARLSLQRLPGGRVHHLLELGSHDGTSWRIHLQATYVPAQEGEGAEATAALSAAPQPKSNTPEARPSTAAAGAPVDEAGAPQPTAAPDADSAIVAISERVAPTEIPRQEAPQVHMASPMSLEIPLGPLHLIPDGSGWSTDETDAYVCRGVTLKKVTVARGRAKRGRRSVDLSFWLHTSRRSQRIDLTASLLSRHEIVETVSIEDIFLGSWVPAHTGEGLRQSATISLDEARFQEIFGGENRPVLRVTLTVP